MDAILNKIEGNLTITNDTILHGMVIGNVEVIGFTVLEISGTINGEMIVNKGNTVILHGTVNGDVINNGGDLAVYGTINGRLFRENGRTIVESNAIVRDM
ncbi:polymer-forming cytoskeletal protein [Bacillus sp. MUM 13]|uniref:polymer-forming cytoskeletal protein n=1 Tax=Bacillus sp. MUM 13 TaxID=1678001 RepID=UPI0008F5EF48|nr:polymer-forming cytoskeletal protein [Bacillus sp. MUM 13]OIK05542.1 hypothetical protein BIV59_21750 [Bacillus sp. MUM 13]